jgi:hypothetical protein
MVSVQRVSGPCDKAKINERVFKQKHYHQKVTAVRRFLKFIFIAMSE